MPYLLEICTQPEIRLTQDLRRRHRHEDRRIANQHPFPHARHRHSSWCACDRRAFFCCAGSVPCSFASLRAISPCPLCSSSASCRNQARPHSSPSWIHRPLRAPCFAPTFLESGFPCVREQSDRLPSDVRHQCLVQDGSIAHCNAAIMRYRNHPEPELPSQTHPTLQAVEQSADWRTGCARGPSRPFLLHVFFARPRAAVAQGCWQGRTNLDELPRMRADK